MTFVMLKVFESVVKIVNGHRFKQTHILWIKKKKKKTVKKVNLLHSQNTKCESPGHELFKPNKIMQQ